MNITGIIEQERFFTLLKIKFESILIFLLPLYLISVNTMFMPIVKEIVFIAVFTLVMLLMYKNKSYRINNLVVINTVIFLMMFSFIVNWDISPNDYLLFLYRKFQYIFVMMSPFLIYEYTRNSNIFDSINIAIFILIIFLYLNLILNLNTLEIGKFTGLLLSRPGAGVLAFFTFIYFLYVKQFYKKSNNLIFIFYFFNSAFITIIYVIYSGSKTAGFSLVIIFFLILINNFNFNFKKIFYILFIFILFMLLVPIEYFDDLIRFSKGDEISSSAIRYIEWNIAIDIIKIHWFFGVGWDKYGDMINNSLLIYGQQIFPFIQWKNLLFLGGDSSSQNVFIDNIAIYGIIGLLYNIFLIYILKVIFNIDGIKGYILPFLIVLLLINNFNFGNGYEPIFWFLVGIVLLKKKFIQDKTKGKINFSDSSIQFHKKEDKLK